MAQQKDSAPGTSRDVNVPQIVTLVFNEHDPFDEETSFLMNVSDFFETMFRSNLYDGSTTIELNGYDGAALKFIFEKLREGLAAGRSISDQVKKILTPDTYKHMNMILIKAKLEEIFMQCEFENLDQFHAFKQLAEDYTFENLKACWFRKVCSIFPEYRKTDHFKSLSFQDLKAVLTNKYLDLPSETHVLKAVFAWIKNDIASKEEYFADALSLIDWTKIKMNQLDYLTLNLGIVQSNETLRNIVSAIYMKKNARQRMSALRVDSGETAAATIDPNKRPARENRSIALLIQIEFIYLDAHYVGALLFDCSTLTFKAFTYVCKEHLSFELEFDIYDFKWYLFGKAEESADPLLPHPCKVKMQPMLGSKEWKTIGGFGPVYRYHVQGKSARKLDNLPASKVYGLLHRSDLKLASYTTDAAKDGSDRYQDTPINVQRCGRQFFIFSSGCDVFDSGTSESEVLWSKDCCDSSQVKFPQIFSALKSPQGCLELINYNIVSKNARRLTWDSQGSDQQEIEPPTICGNFITPYKNVLAISEKYKKRIMMLGLFSARRFRVTQPDVTVKHPILCQFEHGDVIYLVLMVTQDTGINTYKLKKVIASRGEADSTVRTDLGNLDEKIKEMLSTQFKDSDGNTLKIKSHKKFKLVNSAWVV